MVSIGPGAIVSQKAYLCTATHSLDCDFTLLGAPIRLEAKSWVATSALVGPGVTVGAGGVVGAGSVTMKDVPPNQVVVGNPARPVSESGLARDPAAHAVGPEDGTPGS
jgi:putative colanic acid biosynthesis acetyltransferase WcaF